jgi:hypothetical protein
MEVKGLVAKPECPFCGRKDDILSKRFPLGVPLVIRARCPSCNKIGSIRVCYGCQRLMCTDCLGEHQVGCKPLKKRR